jgi:hypothetical protein
MKLGIINNAFNHVWGDTATLLRYIAYRLRLLLISPGRLYEFECDDWSGAYIYVPYLSRLNASRIFTLDI